MLERAAEAKKKERRILIVVHAYTMIKYCLSIGYELGLREEDFVSSQQIARGWGRGRHYDEVFEDHFVWQGTPQSELLRYSRNKRELTR